MSSNRQIPAPFTKIIKTVLDIVGVSIMLIFIPEAFRKQTIAELREQGDTVIEWEVAGRELSPEELARNEERRNKVPFKKAKISMTIKWIVFERDNYTCKRCGVRKNLSIDHIIPESKGGSHDLKNLQTLCRKCNASKGVKV